MCVCVYRTDTRTNSRGVPSPVSLIARYVVACGRVDCGVARSQPASLAVSRRKYASPLNKRRVRTLCWLLRNVQGTHIGEGPYGVQVLKEQKSIRDDPSSSFRTIIVEWERSPHALQCMSHIEKV